MNKVKRIILKTNQLLADKNIEELEDEYSQKLGCKVVVLKHGLEIEDMITIS